MMLMLIVALALGGAGVYASYKDQKLGAALVVGLTVVTVFFVLMDKDPSAAADGTVPPAAPAVTPTAPPVQPSPSAS
ncbi:hypothetical protein ACFVZD_46105 [Streptomyces sp. NPDC058287]|uniref:hypothetical protein n=1 Tax=Streptomyces sp. NPDC058287 TaxID=3346423 RepID=UPI0036F012D0